MRLRSALFTASLLVSILAVPAPSDAWGFEAHKFIMARAIPLLPRELRPFFERYRTAVVEHVVDPDTWRTVGWEEESPRHFLDMDAYGQPPFTALPRDYDAAVAKFGREHVHGQGLLPWRTEEIYAKLVEAFRQKAEYSRSNVRLFSSVLTHYISDAHVPFHAALNHDGQLSKQWGIHSRFESELFERYQSRLRVRPGPVGPIGSVRDFTFDTLIASFPHVQTILDADMRAVKGRDTYDEGYFSAIYREVGPILTLRVADSITASASLITAAWIEAGRLPLAREDSRKPRAVRRQ
jgi:hypothetical protein